MELERGVAALSQRIDALLADQVQFANRLDNAADSAGANLKATETRVVDVVRGIESRFQTEIRESRAVTEQLREAVALLRSEYAVTRRDVDELRMSGDRWGNRAWTVAFALVSAAAGSVITYLLKR